GIDARFAGRIVADRLAAYFQWTDLVCSPATGGESFSIVLLEAMACEKPIVATRIDGYRELIGDADCGPLVPPADAPALAAGIASLAGGEPRCRALGARGLDLARRYDWTVLARRLEAIYERVLDRSSRMAQPQRFSAASA